MEKILERYTRTTKFENDLTALYLKNPHNTPKGNQRDRFVNVWTFLGWNEPNAWDGLNVKVMMNELGLGDFPKCLEGGKPAPT